MKNVHRKTEEVLSVKGMHSTQNTMVAEGMHGAEREREREC